MSEREPPPSPSAPLRHRSPFLILATSHWVSLLGVALVVTALFTWLSLLPLEARGEADNPYLGLLAFLVVPLILFTGLGLVPIGALLARRRVRRRLALLADKRTAWSRFLVAFGIATVVNVAVGTQATYRAVRHMEEPQFCGSCHVMAPQTAAHRESPHARISCAECHVGDGVTGWFESKLNGTRQFFENLAGDFPRPVPSALATDRLVPAKETCEECHWRSKPGNIRVKVLNSFGEDEENTLSQTVLTMHVGGRVLGGIHGRHMSEDVQIRFASRDPERQDILWVEYRDLRTGEARTWTKSGTTPEEIVGLPRVTMQCVDCHNRVGHDLLGPSRVLDRALANGEIPTTLPYVKKQGLELLQAEYASPEAAASEIPDVLGRYYRENHAEVWRERSTEIEEVGQALVRLRAEHVFGDLGVAWSTYPSNIGHTESPGCFRCHNGDHVDEQGKKITNNCFVCHFAAAVDETEPEVLQTLGLQRVLEKARRK